MSAPKRDLNKARGNSCDRSSPPNSGSVPTLPPLTCRSPAFMSEPPPGRPLNRPRLSQPSDLSVVELPQLVAKVGPEVAMAESVWMEGLGLMTSALAAEIPFKVIKQPRKVKADSVDEDVKVNQTSGTETGKESKTKFTPLTGFEVFETFVKKRHLGELQFYYLKASEEGLNSPYDLRVVQRGKTGLDHYIFSPSSVIHVQNGSSAGHWTLAEWYREAILWKALRVLPFFGNYLLHKAFTRWHRNVCQILFQRKRKLLQSQLLIAVPQFRDTLFQFTRLCEELKKVHWLPQDMSHTYTLQEFQNTVLKNHQKSQGILKTFFSYHVQILTKLQETSYNTHQKLQHQVEESELNQCKQPLHPQQVFSDNLHKELIQSERVLQRLGNIVSLADCMIVQNLVTVTQCEIMAFLNTLLKREQRSLFQAELIIEEDGQLTLCPPMHLFQESLLKALRLVTDSVLQVFDFCNTSSYSSHSLTTSFSLTLNTEVANTAADGKVSEDRGSDLSNTKMVLPKPNSFKIQGRRLRGHYKTLSRKQLEWHLHLHTDPQRVEEEQTRFLQEAFQEIQQLCESYSWLVDTCLFVNQWSPASLERMRGRPANTFKENIQKIQSWIKEVCSVPPEFTSSNKFLTVNCSQIREKLEPLLNSIEKDVLNLLSEELRSHSKHFRTDLKKAVECFKLEPTDLNHFTNYTNMVKHYKQNLADIQQNLDHICSLHKILQLYGRNMTPTEVALMDESTNLWIQFGPLLEKAAQTVVQRQPSMINTLDSSVSLLTNELECQVQAATAGPYLDPKQDADQMISELRTICKQLNVIVSQINTLNEVSKTLREKPLDLMTYVMTAQQKMEARKEIWELLSVSTTYIQKWKQLPLEKFVVSKAQNKVNQWCQQAASLAKIIPSCDDVLQKTSQNIDMFNQQLTVLNKISHPTMKDKHRRNIFRDIGLDYSPQINLSVGDLMSKDLWKNQDKITKICRNAKAEADMKEAFQKLKQSWEGMIFKLNKFNVTVPQKNPQLGVRTSAVYVSSQNSRLSSDSETLIIMGLEALMAQTEDSVMTLSSMLLSPHICEIKREVEHWVQLLQELEELLDFCERFQQKWMFLSKMFSETSVMAQKAELVQTFSSADKTFREIIQVILSDPHVLNFVRLPKTEGWNYQLQRQNLKHNIRKGLRVMEEICSQLQYHLDSARAEFPRLYFLSDGELIKLLSLDPTPFCLLPAVRKCFRGVKWLKFDSKGEEKNTDTTNASDLSCSQMGVKGVFGSLMEHLPLVTPLESNSNSVAWLHLMEECLHQTVEQLISQCVAAQTCPDLEDDNPETIADHEEKDERNSLKVIKPSVLQLISDYPLQCLLVAEEVSWSRQIQVFFPNQAHTKWIHIKAQNKAKLQSLCQLITNFANSCDTSMSTKHTMTALRALVLLTMKHSQQVDVLVEVKGNLESSFEYQRIMTYHHSATKDQNNAFTSQDKSCCNEPSVHVEVLGSQLAYGNEYIGPENWMMVNTTSTDRAFLGILLALTSYRCAFISGPHMSGKESTVLQLGWALGRQVITLGCCANTSSSAVCQMLLGALQTGAWLVLHSVDSMEQGELSILGQRLTDIYQSLSVYRKDANELQDSKRSPKTRTQMEYQIPFEGRSILAKLTYGCIIISSNENPAEIPENLKVALRPISLMQPDYTIIAEVLLTSMGFSEATSISRRLVTVLSLAKDLVCLPDFVSGGHASWLVLLKRIVEASGTHLYLKFKETNAHKFSLQSTNKCSIIREEQAIIKGVMLVLLPAIPEHNRALQFRTILEEIFPVARYFPNLQLFIEESEQSLLRNAVTERLELTGHWADSKILDSAVTLHQALKFSQAVLLVGPAGSGKTTLLRALAGALQQLAVKPVQKDVADSKLSSHLSWCSVDTVVLFPNSMSDEEFFGGCCKEPSAWWDGVFTKALRSTEGQRFSGVNNGNVKTQKVRWLVLDGEPMSHTKWFDSLSTLGDFESPFLCLSSGEKVLPSPDTFKILVETTSLGDATPSALARCSLVYVSGQDLWKAVWKAEMNTLYKEHNLDQGTVKMWSCLAEDLFSSTINALRVKGLTSVMSNKGHEDGKSRLVPDGLQEVMSFIKILYALLGESSFEGSLKPASKQTENRDPGSDPPVTELHAKNIFVVAYIWGFGGLLHPRHWPQFDVLAREALFHCRYKIKVPDKGTVFDHFFNFRDEMLEDSSSMKRSPLHVSTSVPQYEKYAYLLDRLIESHQPALLLGEAGSGKTVLCKSLSNRRPHVQLSVSPLLQSADLRNILESTSNPKTQQHQGLLLFVDDLHEAPFDAKGKISRPLETLRQCISMGEVLTSECLHTKLFGSGAVKFLGTCSTLETTNTIQISPRLSRLFTILVLPAISVDILFSVHSAHLEQWLRKFPFMPVIADMARCIITATYDVYLALCDCLPYSPITPHIVFSVHDLQKVFQGMYIWKPKTTGQQLHLTSNSHSLGSLGPAANVLSIGRLWVHECLRTFGDRISSNEERQILMTFLTTTSEKNFGSWLGKTGATVDHLNQHDNDDSMACTKGSTEFPVVETAECKSNLAEQSEASKEQHHSCSRFLSSGSDADSIPLADVSESQLKFDISTCEQPQITSSALQLLLEFSSSVQNIVFSQDLCQLHTQKEQQNKVLYQERDLDVLVQQLIHIVNSRDNNQTIVFRHMVLQLVHILRALLIPSGHGVLFGATKSTGRKTTVRLATYLTGYHLIEVHRGNEGKLREILKQARSQINDHGGNVVFLIHENISQAIRDELLKIMSTGTFPHQETEDVRSNAHSVGINSSSHLEKNKFIERYLRQKLKNLHVFLLLPLNQNTQTGQISGTALHITRALKLCCCVEVYQPWGYEDLVEMASLHLKYNLQTKMTGVKADKTLVDSIAQAMALIHQSATKYASAFLNIQPYGPKTYADLIADFYHLCEHLLEQRRENFSRMAVVQARLRDMMNTAQQYSQEVSRLKDKSEETQEHLSQLKKLVDTERTLCEETCQHCLLEEGHLSFLEEQLDKTLKTKEDSSKQVNPLYEASLKALLSLNQSDLDEVRHYRQPPDGVVMLINAICLLFNRPSNWESGKQLLGQAHFLQDLEFFDRSNLSDELFQKLGEIVHSPNFQPHVVRVVSQACESLCSWVHAVYRYACAQRHIAPQEARRNHLRNRMAEIRARLRVARLQEEAAQDRLEETKRQLQVTRNNLEDLATQLHDSKAKQKQAAFVIKQLGYYIEKWNADEKEIEINSQVISGDALILAAAITYLGPFGSDIRLNLIQKWHKMCLTGKTDLSPEDPRKSLMHGQQFISSEDPQFVPIPVGTEVQRILACAVGVNQHQHLSQTGLHHLILKLLLWGHKARWSHHFVLLADTLQHERLSLKERLQTGFLDQILKKDDKAQNENEFEVIVSADDPELLFKITYGAKKGLKVLVTEIEFAVPSEEFLNVLDRSTGPVQAPHPEFQMFLITALPVRALKDEIHPLILANIKFIDLSPSTSEIQSVILSDVIQSKASELWAQHCHFQREKQVLQDKLNLQETSLMEFIVQSSIPLLQDPEFFQHVSICWTATLSLKAKIEALVKKADAHNQLLKDFEDIAALATAFYKALQDVGRLSCFYYFPLCKFLLTLKGTLDITSSKNLHDQSVRLEVSHRMVAKILAQYTPGLSKNHAELLRLLLCVEFLMRNEGCSETERVIFLKGFSNVQSPGDLLPEQSASELPSWIPPTAKAALILLEKLPSFHGLVSSLRNSSRQWQDYFRFPSSTVVGPVPCQSHTHLTMLQRAILWKTLCPQWLAAVADDLFACQQGKSVSSGDSYLSAPELISHFLFRNEGPVIITLPGEISGGSGSIHPLYWIKQCAAYQANKTGVKVMVISFGSQCPRDTVLSSLDAAVQTGHWLVLNNCHLLDHWNVDVVHRLRQLMSCSTQDLKEDAELTQIGGNVGSQVHPLFRLWFITKDNSPLSVPAFVRMRALHLVCDSHRDMMEELCCSLRQVSPATTAQPSANIMEPLIQSAILHSVLLQRQKLRHLGQRCIYKWTEEDLLALVDAQIHIAEQCSDPSATLEYIAAYLIYGGHVSDPADLEAVKAVCRNCLTRPLQSWGSGFQSLSEVMSRTRRFDEKLLLKDLRCLPTSLYNTGPPLLGFSAEMTSELIKLGSKTLGILLLESQGCFVAGSTLNCHQELLEYTTAQVRLQALQDQLKLKQESRRVGVGTISQGALHTFLLTEWENLVKMVSCLLKDVSQSSKCHSAALGVRSSVISKLETRADLLHVYLGMESNGSAYVYNLSAFDNPRGFLAALIRQSVQVQQGEFSQVSLKFQVLSAADFPASKPSDGIYLSGLELHGALWNTHLGALHDTLSPKPCLFPLLWVRARVMKADVSHSPNSSKSGSCPVSVYNCPLYLQSQDGDSSRSGTNIVTHVPLKTNLDPVLCTLRGVKLVSTLEKNRFQY